MILGYHLMMTAYGFWLSNDPRGSWSTFVGAWELYLAGGMATKVDTRRSVAAKTHDWAARLAVKENMKREPVEWTGVQAVHMARGFEEVKKHWGLKFFACSILPTHVHLVIGRTDRDIAAVMNQLKGRASSHLAEAGLHPFQNEFEPDGKRATC